MELKIGWFLSLQIQVRHIESTVFEQFDAGKRGAETDFEWLPVLCLPQGGAQASSSVAEKADPGNSGEQAALAED